MQPWTIGSAASLLLFLFSAVQRLSGRPGALALLGRFLRWCFSRPAREIDLMACRELNQAYERALGIRTAIDDLRTHGSGSGNGSSSGSGTNKGDALQTLPTTRRSSMPSDRSGREK